MKKRDKLLLVSQNNHLYIKCVTILAQYVDVGHCHVDIIIYLSMINMTLHSPMPIVSEWDFEAMREGDGRDYIITLLKKRLR